MAISWSEGAYVFLRYNIVSDQNLREAVQKKRTYFERQTFELIDSKWGKVIEFREAQDE